MATTFNPLTMFLRSDLVARHVLPPPIRNAHRVGDAIRIIRARWPETVSTARDDESPVFLLSAGWGSGSTLVQRLVCSDDEALVWGEPHDHGIAVHRLAQMLEPIDFRWPLSRYFQLLDQSKPIEAQWIGNLSPSVANLKQAHRQFLLRWLWDPVRDAGRTRWGLKEVRLTADHARYLKWLFPRARFVFIYRDVIDSYRSCKGVKWFSVWPDYKVARPTSFAHHWRHLLGGFLDAADEIDALLVRYEDFISGVLPVSRIAEHLGLSSVDESVLEIRVGSRSKRHDGLNAVETALIRSVTDDLRKEVGYV